MDIGGSATQESKPRFNVVAFAAPTDLYKHKLCIQIWPHCKSEGLSNGSSLVSSMTGY